MSYWMKEDNKKVRYKSNIKRGEKVDVCIIGAGLTGLTTGYYLSKKGIKVTILEANKVISGVSGATTAKITSQHGLFYSYLVKSFGTRFARKYLEANEKAINNIENIIKEENIDCDFERQSSFVFSNKESEEKLFNQEMEALTQMGFNAKYLDKLDIPIKNFGGIEFQNQAMFNPAKYAEGLSKAIIKNDGKIYENTKVTDIRHRDGEYTIYTDNNFLKSKYVVVATHFPIKDFPGMYFMKMYQDISYVIAVKSKDRVFDGYYINNTSPVISFRNVKGKNNENIVLISGNGHRVGRKIGEEENYYFLENVANQLFKSDFEIIDKWSTQDCISMDKLPFIGRYSKVLPNIYVATGFKKWGMTLSNVAGNIITDKICKRENEYEKLFTPSRLKVIKNAKSYKEHVKETVYSIAINKLKIPREDMIDIKDGEGKIIMYDGEKVGVYKDEKGKCYFVKPICTHLKCELQFNSSDKTWDCPCHGSRFDIRGKVINNPAVWKLDI